MYMDLFLLDATAVVMLGQILTIKEIRAWVKIFRIIPEIQDFEADFP